MKTGKWSYGLMVLIMMLLSLTTAAADEYRWNASILMGGSLSGGDGMGGIGAEIMREVGEHWEIGVQAYAQSELSNEYEDAIGRSYHLTSGYGTLVVKPKFSLGKRWEIAFPLETGNGMLQYRYTGEYREELRWTEEIIDQVNHSVYSAGIEPKLLFDGHGALTIGAGYRGTGPLRTDLADDGELNGFWGRLGYSYRF